MEERRMSDRGSRDRQVMTLLVQLFGREVMDRLAGAGFDAPAAMAKAGAERLAAEAGIPVAIARRVAIVVEESPAPATAVRTASGPKPESAARKEPAVQPGPAARSESPARSKPVERDESDMLMETASLSETTVREERRPAKPGPRKRSEPRLAVEPITPPTPSVPPPAEPASPAAPVSSTYAAAPAVPAASAVPSATSTVRDSLPEEGDPFVDDVALVSWMGLSSHQRDGRLAFAVSDTILDPVSEGDPAPAERDAAGPAQPERPRPADAVPIETPARPEMISGSFWTFGRPADSARPSTGNKPETQSPAASPRRRKHDDH